MIEAMEKHPELYQKKNCHIDPETGKKVCEPIIIDIELPEDTSSTNETNNETNNSTEPVKSSECVECQKEKKEQASENKNDN